MTRHGVHELLQSLFGNLLPLGTVKLPSLVLISELLALGASFEFLPEVLDGVQVRALRRVVQSL